MIEGQRDPRTEAENSNSARPECNHMAHRRVAERGSCREANPRESQAAPPFQVAVAPGAPRGTPSRRRVSLRRPEANCRSTMDLGNARTAVPLRVVWARAATSVQSAPTAQRRNKAPPLVRSPPAWSSPSTRFRAFRSTRRRALNRPVERAFGTSRSNNVDTGRAAAKARSPIDRSILYLSSRKPTAARTRSAHSLGRDRFERSGAGARRE